MIQQIPCSCENVFTAEAPPEINLQTNPEYLDQILGGSFFTFTCPACGKKIKPEFPLTVVWPEKKLRLEALPERERSEFYRRKKDRDPVKKETVIGYPEMADRLLVYRDGLEPTVVEALKYYLLVKAGEQYPDAEIEIWYAAGGAGDSADRAAAIEFHIHGIREGEVAVTRIPRALYQKSLEDFQKSPGGDLFKALRVKTYLSVKNMTRPEVLQ